MTRTNKRVSAIFVKDGKILLIHRRKHGDEYWVVPGGGVEDGESLDEALVREVNEETGWNLGSYKQINVEELDGVEHYFYVCDLGEGEPILGGPEADDNSADNWYNLEWVEVSKLSELVSLFPKAILKCRLG